MAFYVGDRPAEDLVLEPSRGEENPVDLSLFDSADVRLIDQSGREVSTVGFLTTVTEDALTVEWPGEDLFTTPGLYSLEVTLHNAAGARERMPPTFLVVQGDDGWHTVDTARADWRDAPEADRQVWIALELAKREVLDFAPELEPTDLELVPRPPIDYVQAQIMQARNLWNVAKTDPANGGMGEDSFIIRPFPLDWMIQQVLRPKTRRLVVG
jgi:hypothetical protein